MNYPDLKPGIKALVLPHPLGTPMWVGQIVEVLSAPSLKPVLVYPDFETRIIVVCKITRPTVDGFMLPGNWAGWPASALMSLPGDEDAKKLFDSEQKVLHKGRWRKPSKIVEEKA